MNFLKTILTSMLEEVGFECSSLPPPFFFFLLLPDDKIVFHSSFKGSVMKIKYLYFENKIVKFKGVLRCDA